jgi:hypothetical protein
MSALEEQFVDEVERENEEPLEAATGQPESLMDRLRGKLAQAREETTVDLDIPGYDGELVARYRGLDPVKEGEKIARRVERQFKSEAQRGVYTLVDALVTACEGIFVRNVDGELEPLDPDGLGPCCYDERLAEFLGIDISHGANTDGAARRCLLGVFAGNKVAIAVHGQRWQRWMATGVSDGEALGES